MRDEYLGKEVWCPACKAPLTLTGERVPNHEVFVSYSNKDKAVADAICATLEEKHIRCWIAPRDISAGNSWGGSIIEAIEDAQVMVLVYSAHSNLSPQIIREIERAVAKGLLIVPFRIEAAPMSKDMEYFLSSSHWFDALTPPVEQHLAQFAEMVRLILFKKAQAKDAVTSTDPVATAKPRTNTLPWKGATVGLLGVALAIGAVLWTRQDQQAKDVGPLTSAQFPGTAPQQTQPAAGSSAPINANLASATAKASNAATAGSAVQTAPAVPTEKPRETPTSAIAPEARVAAADITISCSAPVSILPLTVGQLTKLATNGARPFRSISPELIGWKFVSVTPHSINSYVIRVNRDGILYAFGGAKKNTIQAFLGTEETGKWEEADDAIVSAAVSRCLRRKVIAGDIIKLMGQTLQLAAKSIELMPAGKAVSATQPIMPTSTPAVIAPDMDGVPAAKRVSANITISCSEAVRVEPLEVGQPTAYDLSKHNLRLHRLESVSPELAGWQFLFVPLHKAIAYEIRVNQDGFLYALGSGKKTRNSLGSEEARKWEDAAGQISGSAANLCIRRKVVGGEIIKLQGIDLRLAAKSIELLRDGKPESAMQPAVSPRPVETPKTTENTKGAAIITITCSDAVRVLPLAAGQLRLYTRSESAIRNVIPELSGWQFTSIPQGFNSSYEVRVNQDGVLYAFGHGSQERLGIEDNSKWEAADGAIRQGSIGYCLRRKVAAGEIIKLTGNELEVAAKSIQLVTKGNAEPTTKPAAPVPAPSAVAPVVASAPVTKMEGATITLSCPDTVCVASLEPEQLRCSGASLRIKSIGAEMRDWQFSSIPARATIAYKVRVDQAGVLYAFGGSARDKSLRSFLGAEEVADDKWENAADAIVGSNVHLCLRRKVTAGEVINLNGLELQLAAKNIYLDNSVRDEKAAADKSTPVPTAQSGQPWTNSLGMIFVPVPGTAVQFSIWDTRVQDYQAFVTATGRSWQKPNFEQGPTHPAVNVFWDDAKAFCAWLTEKERRAGTLNSSQEYRLPTDLEWSAAMGLETETGNTPRDRQRHNEEIYPWGTDWPPPRGAGNYPSSLNADDFANTSPVGSFAANRFGLYDMGGNVWQWCEDFYNGQSNNHVMRGGSWKLGLRDHMLSSFREYRNPDIRVGDRGFRCVLTGGGASAAP